MKSRVTLGTTLGTFVLTYLINSWFYGKVVAKLPFQPYSIISNLSHRGVEGEDLTQCGMTFIYVLL